MAYEQANQSAAPRIKEINEKLRDVERENPRSAECFHRPPCLRQRLHLRHRDRKPARSAKQRKQKNLDQYKQEVTTVEYPDGSKQKYNFPQLEETYNELRNERTDLSAELGELIKPVNEQKEKLDAYVSEHMVNLTPTQLTGLQDKTESWDPKILQINVPEANIVDRCESCHMGIREPVKLTAAAMSLKGRKPDEYARAFTSHPEPDLLKTHDPDKVRLLAVPPGQWPRHHQRRESPRQLRALALASIPKGKR